MSKIRFVSIVALVTILMVTACSQNAVTPTTAPATENPIPVVTETAAATVAPTAASLAESIVFTNTGGDWGTCMASAFEETFTKNYGVKLIEGPSVDDGMLRAMVDTGTYTQDVVFPSVGFVVDPLGEKYLEPIDYSQILQSELLAGTYTKYAVALDLFSYAFGYRTDKGVTPTKWEDFFDTIKFPGKRGLSSWDYTTVIIGALLADGVAPDKLLPLDYERAFKKLDTIKKDIVWYDTGSAGQDLLATGEVSYIQLYANRITSSRDNGAPLIFCGMDRSFKLIILASQKAIQMLRQQ